jgi:hypothetical protein
MLLKPALLRASSTLRGLVSPWSYLKDTKSNEYIFPKQNLSSQRSEAGLLVIFSIIIFREASM